MKCATGDRVERHVPCSAVLGLAQRDPMCLQVHIGPEQSVLLTLPYTRMGVQFQIRAGALCNSARLRLPL